MTKLQVLHVEDERNARLMVADLLGEQVALTSAESAEVALEQLETRRFDLTLLDWTLPGIDGGAFLRRVREHGRAGRVVVVTAIGTLERAQEALRAGAYDFLVKPVDPDDLLGLVAKAERSGRLLEQAGHAAPDVRVGAEILGSSSAVRDLRSKLELVASADATVLIAGESGTGKELVARALHEASGRHRQRLVTVNCAAIPESLFESEVFGHTKGAFTGAHADRVGYAELAHGGTLFLDEVGELAPAAQAKLLRLLQDRRVRRVGASKDRAIDLRVIAATNRDLEAEVERGAFRADLLYRLDVIRLEVPPLRSRGDDVRELLAHFLTAQAAAHDRPVPALSPLQQATLEAHPWPGNIRELENVAQRIVLLGPERALALLAKAPGQPAAGLEVDARDDSGSDVRPLKDVVQDASRSAILTALQATSGSRTQAAKLLGVSRKTLFNKMQELGIKEESSWS
ncbi:MAG: sigma-54-dependent Fis family transcriptional regulator [Planctomycetes bacterium]|nr:sigma-54-dependent Fis family transcriptional regulator [Planctomycetota bacterium]